MKLRSVLPKILTYHPGWQPTDLTYRQGGPAQCVPLLLPCVAELHLSSLFSIGFQPPEEGREAPRALPQTPAEPPPRVCVCEQGSICLSVGLVSLAKAPHRCVTFLSFFICLPGLRGERGGCSNSFQSKKENERGLISLAGTDYLKVVFKIQIYL